MAIGPQRLHKGAQWILWVQVDKTLGVDEMDVADAWLYAMLHGDATLSGLVNGRIYEGALPEGVDTPYVSYFWQASQDDQKAYGSEVAVLQYVVQAVDQVEQGGSYAAIRAALARVHVLLQDANGTAAGGTVDACERKALWRMEENPK